MIKLYVRAHGFEELRAELERLPKRFIGALDAATRTATQMVATRARESIFAKFKNLHGGADAMAGAIGTHITRRADRVTGTVGFGEGFPQTRASRWMRLHEEGGTVRRPFSPLFQVFPDRGAFAGSATVRDGLVFTSRTRAHDITIPARPFLKPAFDAQRGEILELYRKSVFDVVRETRR